MQIPQSAELTSGWCRFEAQYLLEEIGKHTFNESKIDASEFLPNGKDKKVVPRDKDFDLGIRQRFEKSIGEKTKLRRQRFDEIVRDEKNPMNCLKNTLIPKSK